ncbi:GDNF-inducible zinc finger protein 1 [Mugil cephalus]|uniref:GDNF-inducible zinc finger protein 1 n=1 Tax=Mugil cephalus TaxID=48193 RepID=UPI001FB733B4|nr:GDNF-inducible zinc finger protein 1 [Mugil cephalus]XP_047429552.1 GDNF-inducible zinc finger protein 1 [Mugil cephalus]XP_047429553.1 GDNF-inducible zinc finger protein 1 [Mugil cephalus]
MMGLKMVELTSNSHHESILSSLQQLRLEGQLSDITVQVDFQGDVQEFRAHQVMLAASSGYFKKILLSQDATQDKLLLSNMHWSDFSKFLEFVYTGKVEVVREKISDVQAVAQFLDCEGLLEVCGGALSAGILQKPVRKKSLAKVAATDDLHDDKKGRNTKGKKQPGSLFLKRQRSPRSSEKEVASKRFKAKATERDKKTRATKLKLKLAGHEVLQMHLYTKKQVSNEENQVTDEDAEEEDLAEADFQSENHEDKGDESLLGKSLSEMDDWESEDDVQRSDTEDSSLLTMEEEDEDEERQDEASKRTSKAQFQCNKCQRTFHYEKSYLKHISTYHGVKADVIYRCETCSKTFANRSNLKIHEKHVHNNERLFTCDSCTKTFKRKKDVVRHQRQVHERNLRHVCPECGKALSSKTALLLHERTHTGTKPFACTDCGARFTQNAALKMHRRIHTGEKPFACDQCESRFTQKHMLAYHKRSHTGEKPFMCEACGKSFASKEYLRHHSNIHTGSKPYKCEMCGRGFAQRNCLNQHLKIHTGERPYSCKDCNKQFTQLNALQRHQRIHTGEKPYMCGLCKRTFTDKSTLRRHTMIHDPDTPWKTYLVVLEGNVEEKKTKSPPKGKGDKVGPGDKKHSARKSTGGTASAPAPDGKTHGESVVVPAEPVTLPPDWHTHGTIALVSHGALGGITVIHTEVPPGTQLQPIVTTDGTGASVISLDGSPISVPFSLPVSMAHPVTVSSVTPSTSLSLPALSVPVSDRLLASAVPTSSVLETAASQTILAPVSDDADALQPDIQTVIVGEKDCEQEQAAVQSDEQPRTESDL